MTTHWQPALPQVGRRLGLCLRPACPDRLADHPAPAHARCRVQIGQAKQAIFEDYGLPFASSCGAPSLPPATDAVEPVVHHCDGPGDSPGGDRWRGLHTVAGLDIGYQNEGCVPEEGEAPEKAVACLAVLSFPELKVRRPFTTGPGLTPPLRAL